MEMEFLRIVLNKSKEGRIKINNIRLELGMDEIKRDNEKSR